jgi:hypothetical protein
VMQLGRVDREREKLTVLEESTLTKITVAEVCSGASPFVFCPSEVCGLT